MYAMFTQKMWQIEKLAGARISLQVRDSRADGHSWTAGVIFPATYRILGGKLGCGRYQVGIVGRDQRPQLSLHIQLKRICGIWSINKISGQKEGNNEVDMLLWFSSLVPTDPCKVQSPDSQPLDVAFQRLSSSARGCLVDPAGLQFYEIFVSQTEGFVS